MPDQSSLLDKTTTIQPPQGDSKSASDYINKLADLLNRDKVAVTHTDLKRYDLSSVQDHYQIVLHDYEVEVSHSKQAQTGKDFFVMLFNNIKKLKSGNGGKVILSYIHLTETQFKVFKSAADDQLDRIRKAEELKRFKTAMSPIDDLLLDISTQTTNEGAVEVAADTDAKQAINKESDDQRDNSPTYRIATA